MTTMRLGDIALCHEVQTRDVSERRVQRLVETLETGVSFPPLVVATQGNKLLGGYHRFAAYERVLGLDMDVPVRMVDAPTLADSYMIALGDNATHGTPLRDRERKRGVVRAVELGVDIKAIAGALDVPVPRAESLYKSAQAAAAKSKPARKRTDKPMAGKAQVLECANYLTDRIRNDLVPFTDAQTRVTLRELYKLLKIML